MDFIVWQSQTAPTFSGLIVERVASISFAMAKTVGNRVVVKVFLYGIKPEIWRRFSIPIGVTFIELSNAIQAAMGWANKEPHEFRHGKGKRLTDVIGPIGLEDQTAGEFQDEGC